MPAGCTQKVYRFPEQKMVIGIGTKASSLEGGGQKLFLGLNMH
jgi:hypothetical protein